jgi:hypothetical protein
MYILSFLFLLYKYRLRERDTYIHMCLGRNDFSSFSSLIYINIKDIYTWIYTHIHTCIHSYVHPCIYRNICIYIYETYEETLRNQ